jgi:hypothetical protein
LDKHEQLIEEDQMRQKAFRLGIKYSSLIERMKNAGDGPATLGSLTSISNNNAAAGAMISNKVLEKRMSSLRKAHYDSPRVLCTSQTSPSVKIGSPTAPASGEHFTFKIAQEHAAKTP